MLFIWFLFLERLKLVSGGEREYLSNINRNRKIEVKKKKDIKWCLLFCFFYY